MQIATHTHPVLPAVYPHSPLRYPGGKSRAVKFLYPLIPQYIKKIIAPFFGGGSLELALTTRMEVHGYDIFLPVVEFWDQLIYNQDALIDQVQFLHPMTRHKFYLLQKNHSLYVDKVDRAAIYFALNRSSFSGTTFSGGMSPGAPRFTQSSIYRLRDFDANGNLHVDHGDAFEVIGETGEFMYLDPPYEIDQALYGNKGDAHKGFNHYALFELLHDRPQWVMSYNDSPHMRKLYKDHVILPVEWAYGMGKSKKSNEIVILSYDL